MTRQLSLEQSGTTSTRWTVHAVISPKLTRKRDHSPGPAARRAHKRTDGRTDGRRLQRLNAGQVASTISMISGVSGRVLGGPKKPTWKAWKNEALGHQNRARDQGAQKHNVERMEKDFSLSLGRVFQLSTL